MSILPSLVNLQALESRLSTHWRSFMASVWARPLGRAPVMVDGVAVLLGERAHRLDQLVQHLVRIELAAVDVHAAGFDLGEIENFVDQAEQVLGGGEDAVEILHGGCRRRCPRRPPAAFPRSR